jgi:hypothetical protein
MQVREKLKIMQQDIEALAGELYKAKSKLVTFGVVLDALVEKGIITEAEVLECAHKTDARAKKPRVESAQRLEAVPGEPELVRD